MRIGAIADLHIDLNHHYAPMDYQNMLSHYIQAQRFDLFIIAGDISNQQTLTLSFIQALEQQSGCKVVYVPGNHDMWEPAETTPKHTQQIFDRYRSDPHCLVGHPRMLNPTTALIGHMGWYNYAYAAKRFSKERLATGRYKIALWQDKRHLDWGVSDPDLSKQFTQQLTEDLQSVNAKAIILATHLVTHPAFVPPLPDRRFDFYNAYLATDDIYPLYQAYPIRTSIMGHLHVRHTLTDQHLTLHCVSLGYYQQWSSPSLAQEIADATVIINV
ncbi:MAG: metallophosphoesterase [Aerococcus sp.]|nr:metallophosphoesterase [Aerococcus sp.]